MPITPTMVLNHVKNQIGASVLPLPIDDEGIMEIIYNDSLYTISEFFPYTHRMDIQPSQFSVEGQFGVFYVPTEEEDLEIIGISRMYMREGLMGHGVYPPYGFADSPRNFVEVQLATDVMSAVQVPNTFKFIQPNRIEVFPRTFIDRRVITVEAKCVQPKHMGGIHMGLRRHFLELCTYDVKIVLWNILKQFDDMTTPFGSLRLNVNDWENAKSDRDNLIEEFKRNFIKSPDRKKIFFA